MVGEGVPNLIVIGAGRAEGHQWQSDACSSAGGAP